MRNRKSKLSAWKHLIIMLSALCASGCSSGGSCSSCNQATSTPTPAPIPTTEPTPSPTPVPGRLVISAYAESEILEGDSTFAIVSLESSAGIVTPIAVTITNNSASIVTTNPATCNLTTAANSCAVTLQGLESGSANFSALSSGYESKTSQALTVVPVFAYFANSGGNNFYTQCLYHNSTNSIESATCVNHTMAGSGMVPVSIALDNRRNLAYVVNGTSFNFTQCNVNANGIDSQSCLNITPSGSGAITGASAMSFDVVNDYLYVLEQSGGSGAGITQCAVGANGIESPSCLTTVSNIMDNPVGITLDSINHMVYIVNATDPAYFTQCPVNESGIKVSACSNIVPAPGILTVSSAGIGVDENHGYIYAVADSFISPSIAQCQVDGNGIESVTCTNNAIALYGPGTVNVFRGNTYITDATVPMYSGYSSCDTSVNGILFGSCVKYTPTTGVMDVPRTVAFGK